MAVGAGLSSSIGIAAETTPGTPVAVTRFVELESTSLKGTKKPVQLKLTIDALDEATPSNGFAATVLSAGTTAGAVSFTTAASIPAGSYVTIDTGLNAEVVVTGTPSGSGPYTIPVATVGGLKV